MRNDYRIDIKENHIDEFKEVLNMAGVKGATMLPGIVDKDMVAYRISLSKYELLFVQLASKAERINRL
jgi:hypothetical protein